MSAEDIKVYADTLDEAERKAEKLLDHGERIMGLAKTIEHPEDKS